jgi:hypothetical protein
VKDVDVDLRTSLLTGNNRQAISNVELYFSRRGGGVRAFRLQGKLGRAALTGGTRQAREGGALISLTTGDGGALLSFLDLYRRMEGGHLQLVARTGDHGVEGALNVTNFTLHDEPALRRLVTEGVAARDEKGAIKIDTTAAVFQRLSATITRHDGVVVVRDGVLYGPQIGIKLDGSLDFARDKVDMTGTFVPAYGVNNLFSQVPLFGPLLGGGSHEGLFAVNFHIGGPASGPVLTVNPLSAIAPGFLRKIFGIGQIGAGVPPFPSGETTSSTAAPQ